MDFNRMYADKGPASTAGDRTPLDLLRFLVFEKDGEATIDHIGEGGVKLLQARDWISLSYCAEEVFILVTEEGRRAARTQRPSFR